MFGFGFRKPPQPMAAPQAARSRQSARSEAGVMLEEQSGSPEACEGLIEWTDFAADELVLVSKEDIYAKEGQQMVLLLKAGREITVDELPKFIRNGVNPKQFWLKKQDSDVVFDAPSPNPPRYKSDPTGHTPMTPITPTSRAVRKHQTVLVLDTDAKSLRRTTDCLFRCGFALSRIHPVRLPAHLSWSLQKYRPDVLVVDYHLEGGHSALELIRELGNAAPPHTFLTLTLSEAPSDEEQALIHQVADRFGIRVLLKPLSRYAVHAVLEQQGL